MPNNLAATQAGARHSPAKQAGLLLAAVFFALSSGLAAAFLPAWFVVSVLVMPSVLIVLCETRDWLRCSRWRWHLQ